MIDFFTILAVLIFISVSVFLFYGDPDVMDAAIEWSRQELYIKK